MMDFILKDEFIALCTLLKAMNLVMSGGEGKEVVAQGLVTVDGELELRKRCKIRAGQVVEFQGETIRVLSADSAAS